MKKNFSNADIKRVIVGIPRGHTHIRTLLETSSGERFLFQEATIANIVRAYTTIKTHPQKMAVELVCAELDAKKAPYAKFQLLETEKSEESLIEELTLL
ncbi:MAG: hypothetical protein ACMUJM_07325 [bacterium]